jgi:bifunctional UDP-N-acetylglucosamine pyrophosphorylase / glucosamine-1-phosphate N-acetyltransferase
MRDRILERLMLDGVTIVDPSSTFIDDNVEIGIDSIIQPNTFIAGKTTIGSSCDIGPLTQIHDSQIGENCRVNSSYLRGCTIPPDMSIGPFANLQHGEVVCASASKSGGHSQKLKTQK